MRSQFSLTGATLRGVMALPVGVEVLVSSGLPSFTIVGMPDAAIYEARERVRAAIRACGFSMPTEKVVVNLSPGSLKKTGSGFDLPIALGILAATGQIEADWLRSCLCVGELSLDGRVRNVVGMLAYQMRAREDGLRLICSSEAVLVALELLECSAAESLSAFRKGEFLPATIRTSRAKATVHVPDFSDVAGQESAKRALQVAAAGSHGVLMMGPPGAGKTMLASRLPGILPPLTEEEVLESALVHSVAGEDTSLLLDGARPFRKPHHSATMAGLIGGGNPVRPGEISLACGGVLFFDELAEFKPSVLQAIRQPMESGQVTVTRADGNIIFPARFMVVAASNPCPCGYFGDPEKPCTCTGTQVRSYQNRIGGPLMDRIDIHIDVWRGSVKHVLEGSHGLSTQQMREEVTHAREFAAQRRRVLDDRESNRSLVTSCNLAPEDEAFFKEMATLHTLSSRSIMRTLALARTIADMGAKRNVIKAHLCEALSMRLREGLGSM